MKKSQGFFSSLILLSFILLYDVSGVTKDLNILEPDPSSGRISKVWDGIVVLRFRNNVHDAGLAKTILKANSVDDLQQLLTKNQSYTYNTELKNSASILVNAHIQNIIKAEQPVLNTYYLKYNTGEPPEKYCRSLLALHPQIEIAEPVAVDQMLGSYIPNDPKVSQQNVLKQIQAFQTWSFNKGDTNVIIGISDNGVFQSHEDLRDNIAPNWQEIPNNGIDDDNDGIPDDITGANLAYIEDSRNPNDTYNSSESHGTSVASIAGAKTDNARGMAGIAFNCRIFPIKIAPYGTTNLLYSYNSIVYAALRGCKVLNCSWGSVKRYSDIDQSIIDFAISRGVSIVAASGNEHNALDVLYPAGYRGVLGVGEVNVLDEVTSGTSLGSATRLMAQGEDNVGATNTNGYEVLSGGGTSFAAPVVSGVVALVRSKFPELDPVQANEFVRQCSDELNVGNDPKMNFFVPGRVNMLKAIQTDSITVPSIRPIELVTKTMNDVPANRFGMGDTFKLSFKAKNYLAAAKDVKFVMSMFSPSGDFVEILDSITNVAYIDKNSDFIIGDFIIKATGLSLNPVFFRVDIYGQNEYHDFFIKEYVPSSDVTTFYNDVLKFSVGDRGTFGYGHPVMNSQGVGFVFNNGYSQLYKGCIIATESNSKAVSGLFGLNSADICDFDALKTFTGKDNNIGIFDDSKAYYTQQIGIKIELEYQLPARNIPITRVNFKLTNVSGKTLNDVSVGYYLDWDIGFDSDSNKVRLFPEAIPEFFKAVAVAAEVEESTYPGFKAFGALAFSPVDTNEAQAAGMTYATTSDFTIEKQLSAFNKGSSVQFDSHADCNMAVGMKFKGPLHPNQVRDFTMLIGADDTPEKLADGMKKILLGNSVEESYNAHNNQINIYPNPTSGKFSLNLLGNPYPVQVHIYNYLGIEVMSGELESSGFDLTSEPAGIYLIKVSGQNTTIYSKLIKY